MGDRVEDPEIQDLQDEFHSLALGSPEPSEPAPEPDTDSESDSESSEAPVEPQESVRYYAVWRVPACVGRRPDLVGVHESVGSLAYNHILRCNGGVFQGIRFKRTSTLAGAQALFRQEAAVHQVDPEKCETIYRWG